jgi:uncharacterized protein (DUF2252 family)
MTPDPLAALAPDVPAIAALERGRLLRKEVPRRDHAGWSAPHDRDPVATILASNADRLPDLVPIRMGRMSASPFAFLRGSAAVMAADLARTPVMGEQVQLCGDGHLANFGIFASPERRLVFDLNDFDETHVGPWEWDVKRLAASFVVASRENGFGEDTCRSMARVVGRAYREAIRRFAGMRALEVWYASLDVEKLIAQAAAAPMRSRYRGAIQVSLDEARRRDHIAALGKLSVPDPSGTGWLIRDRPPLLQRLPDDDPGRAVVPALYRSYLRSLLPDRRVLVEKHRLLDVALKVVGVGSVGRWCWIALMMSDSNEPMFLQFKEAVASVLEPYSGASLFKHHGQRVVNGQRLMQPSSDLFLGWVSGPNGRHFYARQLRDAKIKPMVETMNATLLLTYAKACGWVLARAHAKASDVCAIAGYLGTSPQFDEAMGAFGLAYADQAEKDFAALKTAVRKGRVVAFQEA